MLFMRNEQNYHLIVMKFCGIQGVQHRMVLVVNSFKLLILIFFCFVVAMSDLVHDVEAIFHLQLASGNLF